MLMQYAGIGALKINCIGVLMLSSRKMQAEPGRIYPPLNLNVLRKVALARCRKAEFGKRVSL